MHAPEDRPIIFTLSPSFFNLSFPFPFHKQLCSVASIVDTFLLTLTEIEIVVEVVVVVVVVVCNSIDLKYGCSDTKSLCDNNS